MNIKSPPVSGWIKFVTFSKTLYLYILFFAFYALVLVKKCNTQILSFWIRPGVDGETVDMERCSKKRCERHLNPFLFFFLCQNFHLLSGGGVKIFLIQRGGVRKILGIFWNILHPTLVDTLWPLPKLTFYLKRKFLI